MNIESLYSPSPLYILAFLLIIFAIRCWLFRKWPEMDKLVEVIAFGAGIYAASAMFLKAFEIYGNQQEMAWALFTGDAVTGLASIRGLWIVITSVKRQISPHGPD